MHGPHEAQHESADRTLISAIIVKNGLMWD
jgi:hypothetical protein